MRHLSTPNSSRCLSIVLAMLGLLARPTLAFTRLPCSSTTNAAQKGLVVVGHKGPSLAEEVVTVKEEDIAYFTYSGDNDGVLDALDTVQDEEVQEDAPAQEEWAVNVALEEGELQETLFHPPPPLETQPPKALLPKKECVSNVACAQAFAAVDQHPILLFDGACNLCNDWVNFCLDYDVQANFRFASLQSKVGQSVLIRDGRSPDDHSDIILATPQETYARTDAVLRVVSQLEGLPISLRVAATFARIFLPPWFRDAAYKFVAANRHIFGDTEGPVCRLDLDGEYFGRFIEDPELEDYDENSVTEPKENVYASRR